MNKNDHNHAPDLHKEHILEKRRKLKDNAAVSDEPPRKIISKNADDASSILNKVCGVKSRTWA